MWASPEFLEKFCTVAGMSNMGFFAGPPEKIYFSNTPPKWLCEPLRKCLMFQNVYDYLRIGY
jgi:hypothetical protein